MTYKLIALAFSTSLMSITAQSMELTCKSKYFINQPAMVILTANSIAESELLELSLKIDNDEIRKVRETKGQDYSGRTYKNMIVFKLKNTVDTGRYESASLALMLPQGWGEQGNFVGYIIERASDGGTYNKVFCSTID